MATRKRNVQTQTGRDILQYTALHRRAQLRSKPHHKRGSMRTTVEIKKTKLTFTNPFEPDNFGWHESGRATQTEPMRGKAMHSMQNLQAKNEKKMLRRRITNKELKTQKRQLKDISECPGKHTHIYTQ